MTRKDYQLLAYVLSEFQRTSLKRVDQSNVDHVIAEMAESLSKAYRNFDKEKFVALFRGYV